MIVESRQVTEKYHRERVWSNFKILKRAVSFSSRDIFFKGSLARSLARVPRSVYSAQPKKEREREREHSSLSLRLLSLSLSLSAFLNIYA